MQDLLTGSEYSDAKFRITFTEEGKVLDSYLFSFDQVPPKNLDRLKKIFAIWHDAFQETKLPKWKDFSFEKFLGWHSHMRVISCGPLNDQKRTIIAGDGFKKFWGRKTLFEQIEEGNSPSKETEDNYSQYLNHIYNHHYAVSIGVIPTQTGSLQPIKLLELPLSDNVTDITHLLAAVLPL